MKMRQTEERNRKGSVKVVLGFRKQKRKRERAVGFEGLASLLSEFNEIKAPSNSIGGWAQKRERRKGVGFWCHPPNSELN